MKKLKVFYNENQTAKTNTGFSPSAIKPTKVLKSWTEKDYPIEVMDFLPLTRNQIAKAHSMEYVDNILDLKKPNGFGNSLLEVAESLPWTTGSIVAAAAHAAIHKETCASLTSGFHHAGYDRGGGFCTFNGLMIAAIFLKQSGLSKKIGILDLDMHYGNGTEDILKELDIDYVSHYTFGGIMISIKTVDYWLKCLPDIIENMYSDCDVILYQAGADPHINDPLGGLMTSEQMRKRDEIVFQTVKKMGIPVAWNLAGGYQTPLRKVLDIHDATIESCIEADSDNGDESHQS